MTTCHVAFLKARGEKYGLIANIVKWISINESMQEIFCYPSRVFCLELLGRHFFFFNSWIKSSVGGMLIDLVNDLV